MPLRWHGHCRRPVNLCQFLAGRHGNCPQTHTRCITNFRRSQDSPVTRSIFNDRIAVRSSRVEAAKKEDRRATTFAFTAPQSSLKPPPESPTTNSSQRESRPGASSKTKDDGVTNEERRSSSMDLLSQLKKKRSRFAIQEKGKENRLLVNQLLKDKGNLSYDWRVPVEMLERHDEFPNAHPPSTDASLFHKIVSSGDTGSEHQGLRRTKRIKTWHSKEVRLAREISRPSVWSKEVLADYVDDLVEYEHRKDAIPRASQLLDKGSSNVADITTAINDVFHSPTTKRYLSIQAYKTALQFYYDNGLFSKARALYNQMGDSRMDIPTEIFNLVLRGSASSRDLHNFTFILQKCIQRGFKPDIETWNALLTTVSSCEVRAVIAQRMWERGILDSLPRKGNALRLIVQQEMGSRIDMHGDRGAFLHHMDDRYGETWLTTSTGNKLLYEFGKRRPMSETLSLLPGMKLRGWKPDEISLDTLLRQSLLLRQHKYAIEILECFRYHFGVKPGRQAHETLFLLARRSRLLNFARVVWTSACISGHATFKMRNFVFQSLLSNTAVQRSDGRSERFKKLAGNFVVGVNKPKEVVPSRPEESSKVQGPITRQSIIKSAQMLLQSALLATGSPRIQEDLGKLLFQALELDMEWVPAKLLSATDLQQVLQGGIQIRQVVPYSQRRHLRIRQHIARETQKARVIRKVGDSVGIQEPTRSIARSVYARTFRKFKVDISRRVKVVRIRKQVMARKTKASSARVMRMLRRSRTSTVGRPVPSLRLHYVSSTHKIDQTLPVIRKYSVNDSLRRAIARPIQRKPSVRLNTRQRSVGLVRRKLLKGKGSPSADAVIPILPTQVIRPVTTKSSIIPFTKKSYPHLLVRKLLARPSQSALVRKPLIGPAVPKPSARLGIRQHSVQFLRHRLLKLKASLSVDAALPILPEQVVEPVAPESSAVLTRRRRDRSSCSRPPIRKLLVEFPLSSIVRDSLVGHAVRKPTANSVVRRHVVDRQRRGPSVPSFSKLFADPGMQKVSSDPTLGEPSIGTSLQTHPRPFLRKRLVGPTARNPLLQKSSLDPSIRNSRMRRRKPSTSTNCAVQSPSDLTLVPQPPRPIVVKFAASHAERKPAADAAIRSCSVSDPARKSVADLIEEKPSVPPVIRKLPFSDAPLKVFTRFVEERPPAMRKLSSHLLEKDLTPRPLIRKHLAVREESFSRPPILKQLAVRKEPTSRTPPIRKHLTLPYEKHQVDPAVRKLSVTPDGKTLPTTLETAHLHSSLDKVLDLSEALEKGAKLENAKAETKSRRAHLADQQVSPIQEAPIPRRVRWCRPREHPENRS